MKGLDDAVSYERREKRLFSRRGIAIVALAAALAVVLLLPGKQRISAWGNNVSSTVSTSIDSLSSYVGWNDPPASTADRENQETAYEQDVPEETDPLPAMLFNTSLPACQRTYLFAFDSHTGFNGLLGQLARAAVVAEALGFSLLLDDHQWIYGRWTDYFEQYTPDCVPADDWADRSKREEASRKNDKVWKQANHVWGPVSISYLDQLTLNQIMSPEELDDLHRQDINEWPPQTPISSAGTVPSYYADNFKAQARWMAKLWKLSPQLSQMVEEERRSLNWDIPGWDDRPREQPSDVVIGAHVRMGDKCHETNALKAGPLRFAKALFGHATDKTMHGENCTSNGALELDDTHAQNYFDAAAAEVNAILSEYAGRGVPQEPNFDTAAWGDSKPTLLIMSDEDAVLKALQSHPGSNPFRLLHTINADIKSLKHGYSGSKFMQLSMDDRVKSTQPMVRDMELLARHAGGLIFMSISNVGRTLALLPGYWEVEQGRMMAVDNRWFPTAYFN